jgi:hypothetical protein
LLTFVSGDEQVSGWADFNLVRYPTGTHHDGTTNDEDGATALALPGMDVLRCTAAHPGLPRFTEGSTIIRDDRIAAFVEEDLDAKSMA